MTGTGVNGARPAAAAEASSGPLLEREAELQAFSAALDTAGGAGSGSGIFVEAAAGMGKTSLMGEFAAAATRAGFRVLATRASPLECAFAFGVARQLFEPVFTEAGHDLRELLSGPAASAAALLPGPRRPTAGEAPVEPPPEYGYDALSGIHGLAVNVARRRPLLLLADDVHWCDDPSLCFFAFLARRISAAPIVLVVASRPAAEWTSPSLRGTFLREQSVRRLRLRPLSATAVLELVAASTGRPADQDVAEACRRLTGGNPFYLTELLRAGGSPGAPLADAGQLPLAGLEGVELSVRDRLDRLVPAATDVAQAVAVLGDGTAPAWVGDLTDLDVESVLRAADELRAVSLFSEGSRLEFLHPIVRSTVYESTPHGLRDLLHLRAAAVARRRGARAEEVAAHLVRTTLGPAALVDATLRTAAEDALRRGAPAAAAGYLERLLTPALGPEERSGLLLDLGCAEALARLPTAPARLGAALETAADAGSRLRAALALWSTDSFDGRVAAGLRMLRAARSTSEGGSPDQLLQVDLELARATRSWRPTAAEGRERIAALAAGGESASLGLERARLGLVAYDALLANEPRDVVLEMVRRALPISDAALERSESQLLHVPLYTLIYCDAFDIARAALREVAASAERRGAVIGRTIVNLWEGYVSLHAGDLVDAERASIAALAGAAEHGWQFGKAAARLWLAHIALERNEVASAGRFLQTIAAIVGGGTDLDQKGWADHMLHGRALWLFAAGNVKAALTDFLEAGRRHDEFLASCPSEMPWRSNAARCAHVLGNDNLAQRLSVAEVELAEAFGASRALGVALRVHGAVCGSEASLAAAVAVLAESDARLELARARVHYAGFLRAGGRDRDARELLAPALEDATLLGASGLARQARQELRAAGGRVPLRAAAADEGTLSSSELRVVRCAAQGLSNPEIARTLFVSRRTVEAHLYHAYRKLGIKSRAELTGAF